MKLINRLFFVNAIILLIGLITPNLQAQTMEQAVRSAVSELGQAGLNQQSQAEIIIEMVNYHSRNFDRQARTIQGELYSALQYQFPDNKILLKEEAIAGVSSWAILIKGTYKADGNQTTISLTAVRQMNGQMVAKAGSSFSSQKEKFENLVVVLPIEAPFLLKRVAETYTKILRSALTQTGAFNLVSSDIVDAVDADEIQKQYACSREECSAIVAEQVNANQVITTQYTKISSNSFYLTASLKDIKNGRNLNEVAIQHDGNMQTLPDELNNLALKLAGMGTMTQASASNGKTGMVVVKSNPSQANIRLDGRLLPQKTDTLLQNIPIGKHTITVQKGNLGVSQEVIILPDKTQELSLKLTGLKSQVTIQSKPNAVIYLDGLNFVGTTPISLSLSVGKHRLELKKKDYSTIDKTITIKPFVTNKINLQLVSLPEVKFSSIPDGADVIQAGQFLGKTPFSRKLNTGDASFTIKKEGYQDVYKNVEIKPFGINQITADLKKLVTMHINIKPAAAWIKVDGETLKSEGTLTLENQNQETIETTRVPEGKHQVEVGHSRVMRNEKMVLEFSDQLGNRVSIRLNPDEVYLDQLRFTKQQEQYESDLSSWRWQWGFSLVGSGLAGLYAYQENQSAQAASDKQKSYETAILSSNTSSEVTSNHDTALEENDKVKTHNQNAQTGALISVALFGLATWIWLDEPEQPKKMTWQPILQPDGKVQMSFNYQF